MALAVLVSTSVIAQDYSITEKTIPSDDVPVDAWVSDIGTDRELAKKNLKVFAKKEYKISFKNKTKAMLVTEEIVLPTITDKRGDLKAIFYPEGDRTKMGLAFIMGYDIFLNSTSNPAEMAKLKDLMRKFLNFHYEIIYSAEIKEMEGSLKTKSKALKKAEKETGKLKKTVIKSEKKYLSETDAAKQSSLQQTIDASKKRLTELNQSMPGMREEVVQLNEQLKTSKLKLKNLSASIDAANP